MKKDENALKIGAINTLLFSQTTIGSNCDIYGVQAAFGLDPISKRADGKTALIVGAGGAARAAAFALKQVGCRIFITNRSLERAEEIATLVHGKALTFVEASDVLKVVDYLVNTVSTEDELIDLKHLKIRTRVLDAIYAKKTHFSSHLEGSEQLTDGREWLLHQALKAFEIFTNCKLSGEQTEIVKQKLYSVKRTIPRAICLIGMMGSGKNSVANSLGATLGEEVVDLDQLIEDEAGMTISKLIEQKGEQTFRDLESSCLEKVLENPPRILSCGGGILLSEFRQKIIREKTLPVWLWASIPELSKRLQRFGNRPLLTGHDLIPRLEELLNERFFDYANISEIVIPTDDKNPTTIANRIAYEVVNVS